MECPGTVKGGSSMSSYISRWLCFDLPIGGINRNRVFSLVIKSKAKADEG